MKTALIMGATGATGKQLTSLLLNSPLYETVHVLHYYPAFSDTDAVEHVINFEWIEDELKVKGHVHDVFCTIGSTIKRAGSAEAFRKVDLQYVLALGRWAKSKGAGSFSVISSDGARANSRLLYIKTKGEMEDGLCALELPCLNIYRPPLLHAPERPDSRVAEKAGYYALNAVSTLPGLLKYRPLKVSKLAQVMFNEAQSACSGVRIFDSLSLHKHDG